MKLAKCKALAAVVCLLAPLALSSRPIKSVYSCDGFAPHNSLRIPVNSNKSVDAMDQARFNRVISRIEKIYRPQFAALGLSLVVERLWSKNDESKYHYIDYDYDGINDLNGEVVNAMATEGANESERVVIMFGGLARFEGISEDGFALAACHEIGHHIGGKPNTVVWGAEMNMSSEGQSDYFGTLKCFRQMYTYAENYTWYMKNAASVPKKIIATCKEAWPTAAANRLSCYRGSVAGVNVSQTLHRMADNDSSKPSIDTPSRLVVKTTIRDRDDEDNYGYPSHQCRLDTYFQGSLCTQSVNVGMYGGDTFKGACSSVTKERLGKRPSCWFAESEFLK